MATARGNCFDGSEGRGPALQSRDLRAARGLVLTSRRPERRCVHSRLSGSPSASLRHEEATAQGVFSVIQERPAVVKGNGGVLSPEDLGYSHGPADTDPCSGLSEPGAHACRCPRLEPAPGRPGNPPHLEMRLFPFGPPDWGPPGLEGRDLSLVSSHTSPWPWISHSNPQPSPL